MVGVPATHPCFDGVQRNHAASFRVGARLGEHAGFMSKAAHTGLGGFLGLVVWFWGDVHLSEISRVGVDCQPSSL